MENKERPIVVLAAGGMGTRIKSLNNQVPKPMIPIAGKPIIQWEIESLVRQGFSEFIITIGYKAEEIETFLGDGTVFGCSITYYKEDKPMGNFGAVFKLWEQDRLTQDFLFLISDAIYDVDFNRFISFHKEKNSLASLFIHPNTHPYDSGLVILGEGKRVDEWLNKEDKRPNYYNNMVNAGLHILSTDLLKQSGIDPSRVGDEEGKPKVDLDRDVLIPAIKTGRVYGYHSTEYCKDAGTPERFHEVERDIENGLVRNRNLLNKQKAFFLDRDGVINRYVGFLRNIDDFELLPSAIDAIKAINNSGYLCIVVTNQPVIARGEVSPDELELIHKKMETMLGNGGAYLDGVYVCPHHPDQGFEGEIKELKIKCECRKPKPGMLFEAAKDFNIDLSQSWMIGDSWRDVECGKNAGCRTILLNGEGTEHSNFKVALGPGLDYIVDNLFQAVELCI